MTMNETNQKTRKQFRVQPITFDPIVDQNTFYGGRNV